MLGDCEEGMTEAEAMALTDSNPNAFPCPSCGEPMAVLHKPVFAFFGLLVTHGVDIFHRKPECAEFRERDAAYRVRVLDADKEKRASRNFHVVVMDAEGRVLDPTRSAR